ncbi:hypothetical protein [Paenibacillus xanthanilyticus]|uniref:Uncharacterized protein n=1 Tax=Paenibacillus xanthanilyticus TaxID=1783531 RepID=A0ABV8JX36_9BACL
MERASSLGGENLTNSFAKNPALASAGFFAMHVHSTAKPTAKRIAKRHRDRSRKHIYVFALILV